MHWCKGADIMPWYEELVNRIDEHKTYCRKEIIDELRMLRKDLSESTYNWALNGLLRGGSLTKLGYDSYSLSPGITEDVYMPVYSDAAKGLIGLIAEKYPYVKFTVFETVMMNEFLNHLIVQNTVFYKLKKKAVYIFLDFFKNRGFRMYCINLAKMNLTYIGQKVV